MGQCIKCECYPWKAGVNPEGLPMMKCNDTLEARKWTTESSRMNQKCPHFVGKDAEAEPFELVKPESEAVEESVSANEADENPAGDNEQPKVKDTKQMARLKKKATEMGVEFPDDVDQERLVKLLKDHLKG